MTEIDFLIDEGVLTEDLAVDPTQADAAALEETYFIMPVRLHIRDRDLFGSESGERMPLPILGFATRFSQALHRCFSDAKGTMYLAGGGHINLELRKSELTVSCSLTKRSSSDDATKIVHAANAFSNNVRLFLLDRIPHLERHRSWRYWFPVA